MLQPILTPLDCAACRLCCSFDREDMWELPAMTIRTAEAVERIASGFATKPCGKGVQFLPREDDFDSTGLYACPALGGSGCQLPREERPFECLVWPFRVMQCGDERRICVSDLCEPVRNTSREVLIQKLQDGLAEQMFRYADQHPESIKPFMNGYTILLSESGEAI